MAKEKEGRNEGGNVPESESHIKKCGIIMPISESAGYPQGHWNDVLSIICEAFADTEFTPNLVSKKDSIGLIHESIVTNIYSNEIVICDVSTKNPNVMFELGLRLAFDKLVIIIKDEKTDYSFDTGPIEHLSYPSSLRFQDIVSFKKDLRSRALATYEEARTTPNFSPYLRNFNRAIVPGKIENIEVKDFQFLVDSIKTMSSDIERLNNSLERGSIHGGAVRTINTLSTQEREYIEARKYIKQIVSEMIKTMTFAQTGDLDIIANEIILRLPADFGKYAKGFLRETVKEVLKGQINS